MRDIKIFEYTENVGLGVDKVLNMDNMICAENFATPSVTINMLI